MLKLYSNKYLIQNEKRASPITDIPKSQLTDTSRVMSQSVLWNEGPTVQ